MELRHPPFRRQEQRTGAYTIPVCSAMRGTVTRQRLPKYFGNRDGSLIEGRCRSIMGRTLQAGWPLLLNREKYDARENLIRGGIVPRRTRVSHFRPQLV